MAGITMGGGCEEGNMTINLLSRLVSLTGRTRSRFISLRIEYSGAPTVSLCNGLNFRGVNVEGGFCRGPHRSTLVVAGCLWRAARHRSFW